MSGVDGNRPVFYVEVTGAGAEKKRRPIGPDGILVGRDPTCDIIFPDAAIAGRHAYFYPRGGLCFVEDISSAGELLVNGEEVRKRRLGDGDVVDVGGVRLSFGVEEAPAGRGSIETALRASFGRPPPGEQAKSSPADYPLSIAALTCAALAYQYWAFGLGAVALALFSLRENRGKGNTVARGLAVGALLMGLMGGSLNAWYGDLRPLLTDRPPRTQGPGPNVSGGDTADGT